MEKNKGGRPRKEIDKSIFEGLCELQCTLAEISGVFNCCEDTIEAWCKKTYHTSFSAIYKMKSAGGKTSLRRYQLNLAKTNAAMAIWLGKQWLGQKDEVSVQADMKCDSISTVIDALNGRKILGVTHELNTQ